MVEREPYDLLFGEHKAPGGTQLGRPPGGGRKAADIYAALLAAEPDAVAERKRELRLEAARQARLSPLFFDLTLSLSKSISIFHASLGENARLARQVGDAAGYEYWSGLVGEVDAMIWQAVRSGFDYLQQEAGYTRTGSHSKRVNGQETDTCPVSAPGSTAALAVCERTVRGRGTARGGGLHRCGEPATDPTTSGGQPSHPRASQPGAQDAQRPSPGLVRQHCP